MFIVNKLIDIFAREDTTFFSFLGIFPHFFCYFCIVKVNIHTHYPKNNELTLSTIGIHPYDAAGATTDSIFAIERNVEGYDAVGEIGLDFACAVDKEQQRLIFQAQLEIAQKAGKGGCNPLRQSLRGGDGYSKELHPQICNFSRIYRLYRAGSKGCKMRLLSFI